MDEVGRNTNKLVHLSNSPMTSSSSCAVHAVAVQMLTNLVLTVFQFLPFRFLLSISASSMWLGRKEEQLSVWRHPRSTCLSSSLRTTVLSGLCRPLLPFLPQVAALAMLLVLAGHVWRPVQVCRYWALRLRLWHRSTGDIVDYRSLR